jgi:replicative DNA helicase
VTPYENQIRHIWEIFDEHINKSPELAASIKRRSKNPYEIEFGNGSKIKGFTAGTKAGAAGASIRGQGADVIWIDEADYLSEADIVAVTAIALEAPGRIQIILSSTPSGRRGFFYKVCTDPKSTYRQFHYPSHVNPEWTPEADEEFGLFHSEVDYQHEVLAEFGEEASGVFNKALVEKAAWTLYYTYLPLSEQQRRFCRENNIQVEFVGPYTVDNPAPPALRTMGVDWDKVSSTPQIVIVEYNESLRKFQVVLRESIPKSEFTLDNAVNRIIELNEIYNPAFIYCDRGFGEYQVETLHAYGLRHPETGLAQKVKGKHFGENLELVDPATKELVKKPLKHFMVNQTAVFFERQKLLLSPFDEELFNQIINYSVVRVTASGQPVYTSKNEHALDAMMLAILAFVLEFPELASTLEKSQTATKVRTIKPQYRSALYEKVFGGRNVQETEREPDRPRWQPARSVTSISWAPRGRAAWGFRRRVRF